MLFRDYLAELLAKKAMTNAQLANAIASQTGKIVDEAFISKWLRGRQRPNRENAKAIADTFDVSYESLWRMIQTERLISSNFSRLARYMGEDLDLVRIVDESARQLIESSSDAEKNATFMRLNYKNVSDIDWILSFDHEIYPTDFPVNKAVMQSWLKAENKLSFVLKLRSQLKAFCIAIPVEDTAFNELLQGKREEVDLSPEEIDIKFKNFYIYSNMAIGSYFAGHMLARIAFLFNIHNMNRIGGLVVTEDEDRLCKRLKLSRVWVDREFKASYKPTTYYGEIGKNLELTQIIKHFRRYIEIIKAESA